MNSSNSFPKKILDTFNSNMAVFIFLILFIYNSLTTPNFFDATTLINLVNQSTSLILVALGATLVISAGCIDISLGSGFGWSAVVFGLMLQQTGNLFIAFFAAMISATIVGVINGTLVAKFGIQSMIATMSMMYILRSLARAITKNIIIRFGQTLFNDLLLNRVFGVIPFQLIMIVFAAIFCLILFKHSRYGIYFEACGDNYNATKTAGLRVVFYITMAYVICNIFAAIGGIVDASVVSSADPILLGQFFEFRAIAATVIGGTPITGGKPNVIGSIFGVFILKLVNMMIQMNNVSANWSFVITALIIIGAIIIQNMKNMREKK